MIEFHCKCGNSLSVPMDLAGGEIQCPRCGLLCDVPKMGELKSLAEDGLYKMGEDPVDREPKRIEEILEVFGRGNTDSDGEEIDLRRPVETTGDPQPIPLVDDPPGRPTLRYDPETGERILPIELKDDSLPKPSEIPMAKRVLHYAPSHHQEYSNRAGVVLWRLAHPANVMVMFFAILAHFLAVAILTATICGGLLFLSPVVFLIFFGCWAHFANVIEDIGPDDRDELPRFWRDLSIGDDIWWPFVRIVTAMIYCFGPIALCYLPSDLPEPIRWLMVLFLQLVGFFMFPAALLTITTSGSILNLRPDRLLKMIRVIGVKYIFYVILGIVASVLYMGGFTDVLISLISFFAGFHSKNVLYRGYVAVPMLLVGIVVMHYFCWMLGLLYRRYQPEFPWVFQFHHHVPPVLPGYIKPPRPGGVSPNPPE